ncbi:MAG: ribose 1,5-bisphosphate isomerase [Nitrososphaeria archaeon]|nr:ribose 1,5-bisphosphate isomerase [Nitrososphaeria archaeon]
MNILEKTFNDIRQMRVRGAGRIARAAVKALEEYSLTLNVSTKEEFIKSLENAGEYLKSSRPTAVSLPNAINYVISNFKRKAHELENRSSWIEAFKILCEDFIEKSINAIEKIGVIGAKRVRDGDILLTHCNSEAALSVILSAHKLGKNIKVYCTETRPKLQGLTSASILSKNGVEVTLIVDSAVRYFMNKVDQVIVGADAITANGAIVNKIGTSLIALAAKEARSRFMVAAESYKISPQTFYGDLIIIEERPKYEIVSKDWLSQNKGVKVSNPAFDITPAEYIDAIITEIGIFPPQGVFILYKEMYGFQFKDIQG